MSNIKDRNKSAGQAWIVCLGCMIVVFVTIGLANSSFAVFQPFFISEEGLTNSQASSLILVRGIFSILTASVVVPFYKKISYRLGLMFSVSLVGVGYLVYGLVPNFAGVVIGSACCGAAHTLGGMVAISVIIGRWFKVKNGFALGICLASSGLSSIILPQVATYLINIRGLFATLIILAAVIFILAALSFILIREKPDQSKGWYALSEENNTGKNIQTKQEQFHIAASNRTIAMAIAAYVCVGGIANAGYAHYSVLYTNAGFSSQQVSILLSILGLSVMLGKIVYGAIADKRNIMTANYFSYSVLILGTVICCFAGHFGFEIAVLSMILIGFGVPVSTNGISMCSQNLSSKTTYASTVNKLTVSFQVGSIIFAELPGVIADATGSYAPSYVIFAGTGIIAAVLIQMAIYKNLKQEKNEMEAMQRK